MLLAAKGQGKKWLLKLFQRGLFLPCFEVEELTQVETRAICSRESFLQTQKDRPPTA